MTSNPYLSPTIDDAGKEEAGDSTGISQQGYLQYRRAAAYLMVTVALFFTLICASMFLQSMVGDAMIASVFPVAIFVALYQFLKKKTPVEAQLSLQRYRVAVSTLRPLCFMIGPLMLAVGITQVIWVPAQWQMFPWSFLVCGPATFCGGFLWPQVEDAR